MILAAVEIERPEAFRNLLASCPQTQATTTTTFLPTIVSTPEGIPYISNPEDVALDPSHSRCLGLVLVRGIDVKNGALQVLTPIPPRVVRDIRAKGRDIVFVYGKFDAPTWAYTEEMYMRSGQEDVGDKGIVVTDEDTSEDDSDEEPENPEAAHDVVQTPWVEVLKGNEKRPVGSRVWRVRRDLGRSNDN
jgi:polynucleotide 5'-hydroxyl-kinase GRC3/NOL9